MCEAGEQARGKGGVIACANDTIRMYQPNQPKATTTNKTSSFYNAYERNRNKTDDGHNHMLLVGGGEGRGY